MDPKGLAREYYRTIDQGDYEALADVLDPGFVQHRPDMTLEGRDRFVAFMREDRPETDTVHDISTVFTAPDAIAVQGRVVRASGEEWFGFVDVFTIADGVLASLHTYTDGA